MSENLVESIREKTGETDLDSILKICMGGYTKRSVLDYLTMLKQQQQNMKDAYQGEISRLAEEKETLRAEVEAQTLRADRAEADKRAMEQLAPGEAAADESADSELAQLRREKAALEQDMEEAIERIRADEQELFRMESELKGEKLRAAKTAGDAESFRIMLDTAQRQKEEQEKLVSEQAIELARVKEERALLAEQISEGELAGLRGQVEELLGTVSLLHDEVALRDSELSNRAARIRSLTLQEQKNHAMLDRVRTLLDQSREQNEWLESENNGLGERLHQQMIDSIDLHREIARLKAANGILQRRLNQVPFNDRREECAAQETLSGGASFETEEPA